jgi:hypothetical protein
MRLALLKTGSMAEAVLTPRYKDLDAGIWTRAAPLTTSRYPELRCTQKKKRLRGASLGVCGCVMIAMGSFEMWIDGGAIAPATPACGATFEAAVGCSAGFGGRFDYRHQAWLLPGPGMARINRATCSGSSSWTKC